MLKRRFQSSPFFLMPFVLLSLWGCATDTNPYLAPAPPLPLPASPAPHKETVQRRPWDLWSPGRDLVGAKILDPRIVAADRLYVDGDLAKAAAEFASIKAIGLPENERAALAMRTAATQLSLDQPTRALATLSNFFRAEGRSADAVGADFAILFGYAYGRGKDLEQSLAWFSRAERTAPAGMLSAGVAQGVRYFLEGVPAEKFDALDTVWSVPRGASLRAAPGMSACGQVPPLRLNLFRYRLKDRPQRRSEFFSHSPDDIRRSGPVRKTESIWRCRLNLIGICSVLFLKIPARTQLKRLP